MQTQWLQSRVGAGLPKFGNLDRFLQAESQKFSEAYWQRRPPPPNNDETPTDLLEKALVQRYPELKSPESLSSVGCHARAWLIPSHKRRMSDSEFSDAMRLRCRVPILTNDAHCLCGARLRGNTASSDHHFLRCRSQTGATWLHRHNDVVSAAQRHVQSALLRSIREPTFYEYDDDARRRPDLTVCYGPSATVAYDVTVVYPSDVGANESVGITAARAASDKIRAHGSAVEGYGHNFVPLAFETFGHFDKPVDTFIADVCEHLPVWRQKEAQKEVLIEMSSAIWRGNALLVRTAVEALKRRAMFAMVTP